MANSLAEYIRSMGEMLPGSGLSRVLTGRPNEPIFENNHAATVQPRQRPADWAVTSGVAETISPTMGAYGMGHGLGTTYQAAKAGDYGNALEAGLPLAAAALMPMARARPKGDPAALGYSPERFYRGESGGKMPTAYNETWLSRSKEYADGFARKGGQDDAREFRIKPDDMFVDYNPVDARSFARIIDATTKHDPKFAAQMVDMLAPGKDAAWFAEFARRNPDMTIADSGATVRQQLASRQMDESVLRTAGYRGIDAGRDVRMLTGDGIRLWNAEFDPAKANSRNIAASVAPAAIGAAMYDDR